MRLAEALARRSYLTARMADLRKRAVDNAQHQEDTEPAEDPAELRAEHDTLAAEFADLANRINATNLATGFGPGTTVTAALARRDSLRLRHRLLTELATAAAEQPNLYSRSEIRQLPSVDVRQVRRDADSLAMELRELDSRLQELNWTTDLVP
ncbi:hypothetical protein CLV63_102402 [Murinocardiopsis flavida]|uniref:DIP1984 family protein n=1 Tax=Murinocardiopsis flavida TaxID=645275 RepID=A0A2P8DSV4_9ACTN|nr:DIP1984 family protein [Murinocardiopsis flavida]PSL00275.1 hypothetical protein CLV63_102402 [Murinocardiopsis flavida]